VSEVVRRKGCVGSVIRIRRLVYQDKIELSYLTIEIDDTNVCKGVG
jgi:hypothetical protein